MPATSSGSDFESTPAMTSAVFFFGEPRRLGIGRGLRQCVNAGALGITLPVRQRVGVNGDEQRRAGVARDAHAIGERTRYRRSAS